MPILVATGSTPAEWAVWWPLLVEAMPGEHRDRDGVATVRATALLRIIIRRAAGLASGAGRGC